MPPYHAASAQLEAAIAADFPSLTDDPPGARPGVPPGDPPGDPAGEAVVALVAAQLDMVLPAECVPGVGRNLAVLADHRARLRGWSLPAAPPA